jgi:hypothetical protein
MNFREFLQSEEQSGSDKGLMGFGISPTHKPSDGQPFKKFLSPVAGGQQEAPKMMRKRMKKT